MPVNGPKCLPFVGSMVGRKQPLSPRYFTILLEIGTPESMRNAKRCPWSSASIIAGLSEGGVVRAFGSGSVALPAIAEILPPVDFFFARFSSRRLFFSSSEVFCEVLDEVWVGAGRVQAGR